MQLPAPDLGPFPSPNQMSNQILVPGPNLFQSRGPGPSPGLGQPLGHTPGHGQGPAPDPNLAATPLGMVGSLLYMFSSCNQVIEVETLSMLCIFNNLMVCLSLTAALSPCSALWCEAALLIFYPTERFSLPTALPRAPTLPCFPGRALQGMSTALWWVYGIAVMTDR